MKKNLIILNSALIIGLVAGGAHGEPFTGAGKVLALMSPAAAADAPQQAGEKKAPQWKSTEEYNAFQAAANEKDPRKKISLTEAFLGKYGDTDFKDLAYLQELAAYQQLGDGPRAIDAGEKALAANPDNLDALRYVSFALPFVYKAND